MSWGNGRARADRDEYNPTRRGPYTRWGENRDGTPKPMWKVEETIGRKIREARIAANYTQAQLIFKLQHPTRGNKIRHTFGRTLLAQLETGKKNVLKSHWDLLCEALPALKDVKVSSPGWSGKIQLYVAPRAKPKAKKKAKRK